MAYIWTTTAIYAFESVGLLRVGERREPVDKFSRFLRLFPKPFLCEIFPPVCRSPKVYARARVKVLEGVQGVVYIWTTTAIHTFESVKILRVGEKWEPVDKLARFLRVRDEFRAGGGAGFDRPQESVRPSRFLGACFISEQNDIHF